MAPIDARYPQPIRRPPPEKIEAKRKPQEKSEEKAKDGLDKPAAGKAEPKKDFIDHWAEKNDGTGLRANSIKSFSDLGMLAKGGRDVRTEKLQFGPMNLPIQSDKARRTVATRNTQFTRSASGLGGALGVSQLKSSGATMVKDLRDGFRNGWTRERVDKAVGSTAGFTSVGFNTAKSFTELRQARKQVKDVTQAFRSAVDKQGGRWDLHPNTDTAAHMRHQVQTKADETAKAMAKKFLGAPGDVSVKSLKGIADEKIGWAATSRSSKLIARQGLSAAKLATKAGGRFVPGANVAIAAADTASFYSTLHDKSASPGKKIAAGITAAGSVLAATNIPVASQVGAAVSTVSSVVGAIGPEKIGNAAKDVAQKAVKKLKFW